MSLEGDVLGPLDESCEVSAGLDVITKSEVSRSLFEERVDFLFDFLDSSFSFDSFTLRLWEMVPSALIGWSKIN